MAAIIIILVIVVLVVLFFVVAYNGARPAPQPVDSAWSQIGVQLAAPPRPHPEPDRDGQGLRRAREVDARSASSRPATRRSQAQQAGPEQQAQAENVLTGALRQLFALSESYPDLKANQNFLQLQEELTSTEDRIAYARQFYNDSVQKYNTKIQTFPTNDHRRACSTSRKREFFEAEQGATEVPKVQF